MRGPFRALLAANAVSIAGTSMTFLAIPWFVLVTTGSATRTGVVAACELVPLVLASALGGPLVDRVGARRASVLSDLLSAVGIGLVPLLHLTVGVSFGQLCVLVGLVGFLRAPGDTARHVLLPELVRRAQVPTERATSQYDGVSRGARMVGAPLAGALIAVTSPSTVLAVDAMTFLVSALLVATRVPVVATAEVTEEGYLRQLRGGLRYLRADRLTYAITAMVLVTNLLDAALSSVLLPVYARDVLDSSVALGALSGIFGLGALLGTFVYAAIGPHLPRWPVYTAAFLVVGAPRFGLLAAEPSYAVLLVAQLLFGLACGAINPILGAVNLERVPAAMQSRVYGVTTAGCYAGMPLGAVLAGVAAGHLGLQTALVVCGGVYLAATLTPLVWARTWRQMDDTRSGHVELEPDLHLVADLQ